jgi:hypothetical protein
MRLKLSIPEDAQQKHSHEKKKNKLRKRKKYFILVYNPNKMHKSQSLFNLTTALYVSGFINTHLQEHKTTVTTAYKFQQDAQVTEIIL